MIKRILVDIGMRIPNTFGSYGLDRRASQYLRSGVGPNRSASLPNVLGGANTRYLPSPTEKLLVSILGPTSFFSFRGTPCVKVSWVKPSGQLAHG
jgi:hypothetical protein